MGRFAHAVKRYFIDFATFVFAIFESCSSLDERALHLPAEARALFGLQFPGHLLAARVGRSSGHCACIYAPHSVQPHHARYDCIPFRDPPCVPLLDVVLNRVLGRYNEGTRWVGGVPKNARCLICLGHFLHAAVRQNNRVVSTSITPCIEQRVPWSFSRTTGARNVGLLQRRGWPLRQRARHGWSGAKQRRANVT